MKSAAEKLKKKSRQMQILKLLAAGKERKEIAAELALNPGTVNTYIDRLYARLGTSSPAQSLAEYIRQQHPELRLF
jgi:DNA-binding NarL/FixJ family response regulator